MPKAVWNGTILAQSEETVLIEGNHYFPPDSINSDCLEPSPQQTVCSWKGTANYYDVHVGDKVNAGAAWYYSDPKEAAQQIAGYIAFWKGVEVI